MFPPCAPARRRGEGASRLAHDDDRRRETSFTCLSTNRRSIAMPSPVGMFRFWQDDDKVDIPRKRPQVA
jgi:hypothetical protein